MEDTAITNDQRVPSVPELPALADAPEVALQAIGQLIALAIAEYISRGQDVDLVDAARKFRVVKAELQKRADAAQVDAPADAFVVPGPTTAQ